MADIFKSKEVFKNVNKPIGYRANENENVRKLRGLYVTGVYRPPHYIDRTLFVSEINSTVPAIVPFTEKHTYVEPSNGYGTNYIATINNVSVNGSLKITRFTKNNEYVKPANYIATISNVTMGGALKFTPFTKKHIYVEPSNGYGTNYIATINNVFMQGSLTFERYTRNLGNDIPPGRPVLQIRAIGSEPADITSVSS